MEERVYPADAIKDYDEECLKLELKKVLIQLSGILDEAYENQESKADKHYICEVENRLHEILEKKGLI